jgi:hypothetical protein
MGEGQFGGDGSVNWDIDTTNDNQHKFKHQPPSGGNKGRKVGGVDETFGPDFVVSVKLPPNMSPDAFKNGLKFVDGHVVFRIPIEDKEPRQVVVSWREDRNSTTT